MAEQEPLTKDEREAIRDRLIQALFAASQLYVLLETDGTLERTEVLMQLGRAGRHLQAALSFLARPEAPGER